MMKSDVAKIDYVNPELLRIMRHKHTLTLYQTTKFYTGPNWKFLQTTKKVIQKLNFFCEKTEHISGKGKKNALLKVGIVW